MSVRLFVSLAVCIVISLMSYSAVSDPIPTDLAKWKDWVKYEQEFRTCPSLDNSISGDKNNHLCAWPGELQLQVDDSQVRFSQNWKVEDESRIPLPGDPAYWPQSVSVNRQPAIVLEANNQPYILLPKGEYTLQGEINWNKRPESLRIPSQIALLEVTVNGTNQPFVSVERGNVWLGSVEKTEALEKDFLKLRVNRLITDGQPMQMTVALELEVSGRAREHKITQFSNEQYQLMHIQSNLNTRIDSQGFLWVQLKPGDHEVQLNFKIIGYPQQLKFDQVGDDWPQQEIWVYQDNPQLRSTQIEDVAPIDAEQGFMNQWQHLPHFVLNFDDSIKINERQRGMSHNFDGLNLERQMWLSFDNNTYYFFDNIVGQKSKDWRVNTLENYQLTQLSNHGKEHLITYDDNKRTGAEVRTPTINIQASGQVAADKMQHASGWDIAFTNTSIGLNIPPGRKLIHIGGADNSYGDWIGQWKLIDLFFILVTVALVFKTFGALAGGLALVTLTLGYHEADMPMFWWFNLVVAMSLAAKISSEKLTKAVTTYRLASIAILAIVLLPFLAGQIRFTLYPQLEMNRSLTSGYSSHGVFGLFGAGFSEQGDMLMQEGVEMEAASPRAMKPKMRPLNDSFEQKITITGSRIKLSDLESSYEQDAVIQAGKGKPNWQWQQAGYSWNGPVAGDEKVNLMVLSEIGVKFFRIALIIFSVAWLLSLFLSGGNGKRYSLSHVMQKLKINQRGQTTILVGLSLLLSGFFAQPVFAEEYPSEQLLQQLQLRVFPKVDCEPDCVSLSQAQLTVKGASVELNLAYQSGANKAALIPDSDDWRIEQITLNQKPVKHLWKNQSGSWIALPSGISNMTLRATLKDKSDLNIRFNESPKRFLHQVDGWEVSGVNMQRLMGNSVQLTRLAKPMGITQQGAALPGAMAKRSGDQSIEVAQEQSISNLFFMTRRFTFASQWNLDTSVERRAPQVGTISTQIQLLEFEQPLERSNNVSNGLMQVVIPANEHEIGWGSSISGSNEFELVAMDDRSIDESWEILVYPNWNIQIEGIPAVLPNQQQPDDFWIYQYFPRPNEKLHFSISKPSAVKGASVAITSVSQSYQLSKRKTTAEISLNYKATRAEQLLLHVGDAEVKNITHDGVQVNLGKVEGVVSINLNPGEHSLQLQLETAQDIGIGLELAGVKLNQEFTNLTTQLTLPENRWLIAASGPGYGPAIIYWGELIFFALLAIGLSKLSFSPLNYWQWLALGLGMSTFSWPAMALVAAWLLGSEWRRQNQTILQDSPKWRSWLILLSTISAVLALVTAVPFGLLQTPDMGVVGNGSYGNSLIWFLDRGEDSLGTVSITSLPIWVYKGLMLLWATWLSFSLIRWLGWTTKDLGNATFFKGWRKAPKEAAKKEDSATKK